MGARGGIAVGVRYSNIFPFNGSGWGVRERHLSDIKLEVSTTALDKERGLMFTTYAKRKTTCKKKTKREKKKMTNYPL